MSWGWGGCSSGIDCLPTILAMLVFIPSMEINKGKIRIFPSSTKKLEVDCPGVNDGSTMVSGI
jgi:hypothetical protein